jgi:hypothetical protein
MNRNKERNLAPEFFARTVLRLFGLNILKIEGVRLFYKIKKDDGVLHVSRFFNTTENILKISKLKDFLAEIVKIMRKKNLQKLEFVPVNEKLRTISNKLGAKEIDVEFPEELSEKFFKKYGTFETKHRFTLEQLEKIISE